MKYSNLLWPFVILISAFSSGMLVFIGTETILRQLLVLWFLLVCPGMAYIRLMRLQNALVEWILAIGLSLALELLLALALVYLHFWQPQLGLLLLIGLSFLGAILGLFQALRPDGR